VQGTSVRQGDVVLLQAHRSFGALRDIGRRLDALCRWETLLVGGDSVLVRMASLPMGMANRPYCSRF
jgi:hypothetical protein